MLENSAVSLMLMLLLCFFGMLIMFLFMLRTLAQHNQTAKEQHLQVQTALADMERQLLDIHFILRQQSDPRVQPQFQEALHDAAATMPAGAPQAQHPTRQEQPHPATTPLAAFDIGTLEETHPAKPAHAGLELRLDK